MKVARVTTSDCDRVRKSVRSGGEGGFNVKVGVVPETKWRSMFLPFVVVVVVVVGDGVGYE